MADTSLRAFLTQLVDYAGLFPPAKLDMAPAVRNHLAYRAGSDRFVLGRFICPAGRLVELGGCLDGTSGVPVDLSVILRGDALAEDLATLGAFAETAPVRAGAFEIRMPAGAPAGEFAAEATARAEEAGFGETPLYLEAGWPEEGHGRVVAGLAGAREEGRRVHLKIRTGGLEPSAFPAPEAVAAAVLACRETGVPFKATAGLHHPVRLRDAGIGAKMHGFLNLFGGAILAAVHGLDEAWLASLLEEEDPAAFRFAGGRFHARDRSCSDAEVSLWRVALATSFGSCSFDEPRDDLRSQGHQF